MITPSIEVKGLSVNYGSKRVLTNIHLQIEPGKVYAVIGPNGAGKSTLFKAILGLIEMTNGSISVLNNDITKVRKRISYVPQRDEIDWDFPATVNDVVLMGRYPFKKVLQRLNKEDRLLAKQAMQELDIEPLANRQIGQLSGGQQQRVFIARALCQNPDLLFFDEPFVGIDITTEQKIISLMKNMAKQGKTILVVHHDLSTVHEYFDKVIMLNQRLVAHGDVETTFTSKNIETTYGPKLRILNKL